MVADSTTSSNEYPLDEWIETVRACNVLPEDSMKKLCDLVRALLLEEPNVRPVSSPVTVCGDIHGQFFDLLELFRTGGDISETNYIFMGDYVDRGYHSLETITYLFLLKAKYPNKITLLRGNHESRQITSVYGFYEEIQQKYGNANVWKHCCLAFDYLTLTALIDGKILCLHGGLSPELKTLDQIGVIQRNAEIPHEGPFTDMMWSDPEEVETWEPSNRGAGWFFGAKPVNEFNHINGLDLLCRSHQLVNEGYKYMFPDENLITIWSAPNYCYRCGNIAAVMTLDENLGRQLKTFKEVPESRSTVPARTAPSYFL